MFWLLMCRAHHPSLDGLKTLATTIVLSLRVCDVGGTQQGQLTSAPRGISREGRGLLEDQPGHLGVSVSVWSPCGRSRTEGGFQLPGFPTRWLRAQSHDRRIRGVLHSLFRLGLPSLCPASHKGQPRCKGENINSTSWWSRAKFWKNIWE